MCKFLLSAYQEISEFLCKIDFNVSLGCHKNFNWLNTKLGLTVSVDCKNYLILVPREHKRFWYHIQIEGLDNESDWSKLWNQTLKLKFQLLDQIVQVWNLLGAWVLWGHTYLNEIMFTSRMNVVVHFKGGPVERLEESGKACGEDQGNGWPNVWSHGGDNWKMCKKRKPDHLQYSTFGLTNNMEND